VDGVFNISRSAPFYGDVLTAWYSNTYICALGLEANNLSVTKFNGNISIAKLYNRALTATEVLQNYNTLKTRYSFTTINLDTDAQAFITAAGITDSTQQSAINTLVVSLKSYGIWTKMKAIYPMVGGTATTHKFNLKDPRDDNAAFRLLFSGGLTHSSNGVLGNGVDGYADTNMNAFSELINSNLHLSFYSRTANIISSYSNEIAPLGGYTPANWITFRTNNKVNGSCYFSAGNDNAGAIVLNTLNGFFIGSESASNLRKMYRNGLVLATNTTNDTNALPSTNLALLGNSNNVCSGNECAFASLGLSFSDTEAANLYTAVQAFQTTLGRQV
jgi:hypothetical protein